MTICLLEARVIMVDSSSSPMYTILVNGKDGFYLVPTYRPQTQLQSQPQVVALKSIERTTLGIGQCPSYQPLLSS